jgi:hypothetical protein
MKAVVRAAYCVPDQLTLDDLDQPAPGPMTCSCESEPPASTRASGTS